MVRRCETVRAATCRLRAPQSPHRASPTETPSVTLKSGLGSSRRTTAGRSRGWIELPDSSRGRSVYVGLSIASGYRYAPTTSRVVANSSPRQAHERRVLREGASFAFYAAFSRGGPWRLVPRCLGVFTTGSPDSPAGRPNRPKVSPGLSRSRVAGFRVGRSRWSGHDPRGRPRWFGPDPLRTASLRNLTNFCTVAVEPIDLYTHPHVPRTTTDTRGRRSPPRPPTRVPFGGADGVRVIPQ